MSNNAQNAAPPFRVALIGAGAISEHHALALQRLQHATLAGFVDQNQERASRRAHQFGVRNYASISEAAADGVNVAHVLVPPGLHAKIALDCIAHGMHVLVEKPLADSVADCLAIGRAAADRGVTVTVDHSLLFDPEVINAERLIRAGAIGDVVGIDIIRSSEYPSHSGGTLPPHYRDPGEPFRDLGVHALYLLRHFLGDVRSVAPTFRSMGGVPLLAYDEWGCEVDCERGIGWIRLSWNIRPLQSLMLIHGTSGTMRVDLFHMFVSLRKNRRLPKAAMRIVNTLSDSLRPLWEMPKNTALFLLKRRRQYHGVHGFIADFYARLRRGEPPAVTMDDATAVVHWTETVARRAAQTFVHWNDTQPPSDCDVLVTGGAGKLGSAVVERLLRAGRRVRIMARRPPKGAIPAGLEYIVGDLGDPDAVDRAVKGAKTIVHAGAAMQGDRDQFQGATVVGTQNVLQAMQRHHTGRLVHVSSLAILDWAGSDGKAPINEETAYEPHPEQRGAYTQTKLAAELLVSAAAAAGRVDAIILRPGQIFGRTSPAITDAVARKLGACNLVLGDGRITVPLVHIDDVAAAIERALSCELASGTVIQLVDPARNTQNDLLRVFAAGRTTIRIPRAVVFALGWLSEKVFGVIGRASPFNVYRLRSALAKLSFDGSRARQLLDWQPQGVASEVPQRTSATT